MVDNLNLNFFYEKKSDVSGYEVDVWVQKK